MPNRRRIGATTTNTVSKVSTAAMRMVAVAATQAFAEAGGATEAPGGTGFEYVDTPIADTSDQTPSPTTRNFTSPLHEVAKADIDADGGDENVFDPGDGHRDAYARSRGRM